MATKLWIYSASCAPLCGIKPEKPASQQVPAGSFQQSHWGTGNWSQGKNVPAFQRQGSSSSNDRAFLDYKKKSSLFWQHEIVLWCVDEQGKTHAVQVKDYKSHILLFPKRRDVVKFGVRNIGPNNFAPDVQRCIQSVEIWDDARVFLGFTKSKKKPMILVYLKNESSRQTVIKSLRANPQNLAQLSIAEGAIPIKEVLHNFTPAAVQFLYVTGLRYQSWFSLGGENVFAPPDTSSLFDRGVKHITCTQQSIVVWDKSKCKSDPPALTKMCIRIFAHSSCATKTNQFEPSEEIAADEVRYIAYGISQKKEVAYGILDYTQFGNDERHLLEAFANVVERANVQVFVYASDETCKPNCLFYLQKRAERYGVNLHLSKLATAKLKCQIKKCGNGSSSYVDFDHPGVERIDMCEVLRKGMIYPPLDGWSLLDALRHPKLIRKEDRPHFAKLEQLNYHGLNSFSKHETIREDLCMFVRLLTLLELSGDFLVSQQNISHMCNIAIGPTSERGQQMRVKNLMARYFFERHLVVNSSKTKENFIVVKKPQQESSFPNPEVLVNPPKEAMRGEKPFRHVLRQPVLPILKALLDVPHNNVFELPQNEVKIEVVADDAKEEEAKAHANANVEIVPVPCVEIDFEALDEEEGAMHNEHNFQKKRKHEVSEVKDDEPMAPPGFQGDMQDYGARKKTKQDSTDVSGEAESSSQSKKRPRAASVGWWSNKKAADFKKVVKKPKRVAAPPKKRYSGGLVVTSQKNPHFLIFRSLCAAGRLDWVLQGRR